MAFGYLFHIRLAPTNTRLTLNAILEDETGASLNFADVTKISEDTIAQIQSGLATAADIAALGGSELTIVSTVNGFVSRCWLWD